MRQDEDSECFNLLLTNKTDRRTLTSALTRKQRQEDSIFEDPLNLLTHASVDSGIKELQESSVRSSVHSAADRSLDNENSSEVNDSEDDQRVLLPQSYTSDNLETSSAQSQKESASTTPIPSDLTTSSKKRTIEHLNLISSENYEGNDTNQESEATGTPTTGKSLADSSKIHKEWPRKRKHTGKSLADLCQRTNLAAAPLRVGLSKRVDIDHLHGYLNH